MGNDYDVIAGGELTARELEIRSYIANNLNTAIPAKIQGFDPVSQTCSAQPTIKRMLADGGSVDYPLCQDMPVYFMGGNDWQATFPVKSGDECLLVFSQDCIDNWHSSGEISEPFENRSFDLSDGFALVGFRSAAHAIADFDNQAFVIRNKDNNIKVKLADNDIQVDFNGTKATFNNNQIILQAGGTTVIIDSSGMHVNNKIDASGVISSSDGVSAPSIKGGAQEMVNHRHSYTDNGSPAITGVPQ